MRITVSYLIALSGELNEIKHHITVCLNNAQQILLVFIIFVNILHPRFRGVVNQVH